MIFHIFVSSFCYMHILIVLDTFLSLSALEPYTVIMSNEQTEKQKKNIVLYSSDN